MTRSKLGLFAGVLLVLGGVVWGQRPGSAPGDDDLKHAQGTNRGIYEFSAKCSTCHDSGKAGVPDRYALNRFTPEEIFSSITTGKMASYAQGMSELDMRVLSVYVGGRPFGSAGGGDLSAMPAGRCSAGAAPAAKAGSWTSWGVDLTNARYQPEPGLTAEQVPQLKLKWAFGFPGGNSAYSEPAVSGGRVYVGSDTGFVYSLSAASGCAYWSFKANAGVRTAIVLGPGKGGQVAYFGDIRGNVYALNAETGKLIWTVRADTHRLSRITGSPVLYDGLLYVPVASLEESGGGNPNYPCCTFRGALAVYHATTGKLVWKSYTVDRAAQPLKKTSLGVQLWGPAGAALWSAPTLDVKRGAIYVATGNGYTEPAVDTSDSVMAFDMKTGKRLWVNQVRAEDSYVRDCPGKYRPNVPTANKSETCPADLGPDYDFGNAPMLKALADGRSLIVVGQKDGHAWAMDPDKKGAVVWSKQLGLEGATGGMGGGGMQWGSASDATTAYFPLTRGGKGVGLTAVTLATGEIKWRATPSIGSGAPDSVIPGVVFAGSNTGTMYAFSTGDGHELWHYDANHDVTTVNGVEAKGGGFGGASGPVIAGGMVFVPSGYADLFGGPLRGNVILAFGVD
jgi:polyvinyl alcohol dehydrogenase (cytochrome)